MRAIAFSAPHDLQPTSAKKLKLFSLWCSLQLPNTESSSRGPHYGATSISWMRLLLLTNSAIIAVRDGGAEEIAVPFASDLHPEFGYLGSAPRVFRRLGLVVSFVAFGIVAGASGLAVFMTSPDSDPVTSANPLDAMALAPSEAMIDPKPAQPATQSTRNRQMGLTRRAQRPPLQDRASRHVGKALAQCLKVTALHSRRKGSPIKVGERAASHCCGAHRSTRRPHDGSCAAGNCGGSQSFASGCARRAKSHWGPGRHLLSRRRLLTQPPPLSLLLQPPRQRSPPKTRHLEFVTRRMSLQPAQPSFLRVELQWAWFRVS